MGGLGGNCASSGADEEPLGGAANAAPRAAAASDAQCLFAFARTPAVFLAFVGEVALGCAELGLAGLAVDGKVVEQLQIFGGNDGISFGRRGVWQSRSSLHSDGSWQGDLARKFADDLRGSDDGAFLGGKHSEGLRELRIAVVLARVRGSEELLCGGEVGVELRTFAAVRAPGEKQSGRRERDKANPG